MIEFITTYWGVTVAMAPYLLFGFAVAGALSVFVSPEWVERHLGGRGLMPILKAVLLGIPLPLCSCGVIPVTASIRNHGASRGAATGFLLATPQTGVDSLLATWGMLGPVFGIFRPLAALITGICGGTLVSLLFPETETALGPGNHDAKHCGGECCAGIGKEGKLIRALRYGFVTLPRDIGAALFVGIGIAALISTLVPEGVFAAYLGGGLVAMIAMALVGIPIYVCATASIPLAVGFMHLGASPGAALVFLIAGPATNAATITTMWKLLGRGTTLVYLATVAVGALLSGLCLDAVYGVLGTPLPVSVAHAHESGVAWHGHVLGALLATVVIASMAAKYIPRSAKPSTDGATPGSEALELAVTGMTCSHCASSVERSLREVSGVASVSVDLPRGSARVAGLHLPHGELLDAVRKLGYGAEIVR